MTKKELQEEYDRISHELACAENSEMELAAEVDNVLLKQWKQEAAHWKLAHKQSLDREIEANNRIWLLERIIVSLNEDILKYKKGTE